MSIDKVFSTPEEVQDYLSKLRIIGESEGHQEAIYYTFTIQHRENGCLENGWDSFEDKWAEPNPPIQTQINDEVKKLMKSFKVPKWKPQYAIVMNDEKLSETFTDDSVPKGPKTECHKVLIKIIFKADATTCSIV